MIRGFAALIVFLTFLPVAIAGSCEISIQKDNTAVIKTVIDGSGLHTLELPKDAVPEVSGALYLKEGNLLKISIGSTEQAVVSYKTKELTKGSVLLFSPNNVPVKVIFPSDAEIKSISPHASVSEDMKSIEFKDAEKIEIIYSLPERKADSSWMYYSIFVGLTTLALAFAIFAAKKN